MSARQQFSHRDYEVLLRQRAAILDEKTEAQLSTLPRRFAAVVRARAVLTPRCASDIFNEAERHYEHVRAFTAQHAHIRLPANARDSDINDQAMKCAAAAQEIISERGSVANVRVRLTRMCERWRVTAPPPKIADDPAIKRMIEPLWWRHQLRRAHARDVESLAISIGMVGGGKDLHLSRESYQRWEQARVRNQKMLERTQMVNEDGEVFSVAELAAKSVSVPHLKRAELMTRVRGCEEFATAAGHVAIFVTITCPSRMHAISSITGVRHEKYDGTSPREANDYLCRVWERTRSSLYRRSVPLYGFRVTEPHHDGLPHWHVLLFLPRRDANDDENIPRVEAIFRRYALADSPDEPGAQTHRCKFVVIDPSKGSAAGYIAKYITDTIGMERPDGTRAAPRDLSATAWASTHGIRQFQSIGQPSIGVWRELRRIEASTLLHAPKRIRVAHAAATCKDGARASWKDFFTACGGLLPAALHKIKRVDVLSARVGRYGERIIRPVGVALANRLSKVYESVRRVWVVLRTTWTRITNCTVAFSQNLGLRGEINGASP